MRDDYQSETLKAFKAAVNMAPGRLEKWLQTDKSKSVGWTGGEHKESSGGKEAVGHASGRKIIAIKRKKKAELTKGDDEHTQKASGMSAVTANRSHQAISRIPDGAIR